MRELTDQRCLSFARSCIAIFASVILISGCGGSSDPAQATQSSTAGDNSEQSTLPTIGTPVSSTTASGTIQDIWLYQSIQIVQQDGELVDITASVIDSLHSELSEPYPLYGNVTFRASTSLQPKIINGSNQVRDHIDVVAGVLSDGDLSALAIIATPNIDAGTIVKREDRLQLDFSALPFTLQSGDVIVSDYFFAVTLGEDDTTSAKQQFSSSNRAENGGRGPMELLVERIGKGKAVVEAFRSEGSLVNELAKQGVGLVGQEIKATLPAKSHAMIDGLSGGGSACISTPALKCVDKMFESLEKGFGKSLNASFDQVNYEDPDTPPPSTDAPAPFDPPNTNDNSAPGSPLLCTGICGLVANDPHITTFDGQHYSPQPVGEMSALIQTSQSGMPLEMQWRFGALNQSRSASVTTAVAFGFGDTRITLDVNRDVLIALNGEPVELERFPQKQLSSAALGLVLAQRGGIVEIEYQDWLFSIRIGQNHLNITSSAKSETADVTGLLGNLDGDPDNDLVSRDGSVTLGPDATLDDLYNLFLNSWRVSDESSLFDYGTGENTATYTDLTFPSFPAGVASQVTLAAEFSPTLGLDTRRAEGACRRAGISDEPLFGNCVADYVLSGNTEYIVGQQQALDTARRDRVNRFGEGLDGRDLIWWQIFTGSVDLPLRAQIVSNGRTLLVRSRDEQNRFVVDAIDGRTGRKLWRLPDTQNACTPATLNDNLVVMQADGDTDFGGNDSTDDLLLVDAKSGVVLDSWAPVNDFLSACVAPLQVASDNTVVLVSNGVQRGFTVINNQIELLWEHRFDDAVGLSAGRNLDLESNAIVKGNNLFLLGEDSASDGARQYSVYQLDTKTGVLVDRLQTSLTINIAFLDAGPSHLALAQRDIRTIGTQELLLIQTPAVDSSESMQVLWQRDFSDAADTIVTVTGQAAAYANDNSFGVWARNDSVESVVADFDIQTGKVNAAMPARKFNDFDAVVKLRNGDYVVGPPPLSTQRIEPGDAMVQGLSVTDPIPWGIDRVDGVQYPSTLHVLDNDRLVMVVPLSDIDNDIGYTEWAVFAMGTRR